MRSINAIRTITDTRLKKLGGRGCCLVGHPQYYRKFGFENVAGLVLDGVPPEVFFSLSFDGHFPQGAVTFHADFMATGPQVQAEEAGAPG